jgi:hypothetical protein
LARTVTATTAGAPRPAGLSEREVEVLRLIARGWSIRDVAGWLDPGENGSATTSGTSTPRSASPPRPAAGLFAMEQDLLRE